MCLECNGIGVGYAPRILYPHTFHGPSQPPDNVLPAKDVAVLDAKKDGTCGMRG